MSLCLILYMAVGRSFLVGWSTCFLRAQYFFHTTRMASLLVPPASVHGMTNLDRDAFDVVIDVPCLMLANTKISKFMPVLKKYLLKIPRFKAVENTCAGTVVYLDPKVVKTFEDFSENDKELLSSDCDQFEKRKITLKYENWRLDEILKCILPEGMEAPVSYSLIGHIVHLNLRNEHLPYRTIIGQIYLDKVPNVRTVVNKTNTIDTTFRHFAMEILAGEKETVTTVKENGSSYQFDFAHVYWNPRLSTEHMALVSFLQKGDVLYDVFAGVGPFSIPAAKKGVNVLANDLNPESYLWLQKNTQLNKIKGNLKSFNMDGRDFLSNVVKDHILYRRAENALGTEHIAMNLPALAIDFLDVFFTLFNKEELDKICVKPPILHLYCFVKLGRHEDPCELAKLALEEKLGCSLSSDSLINIHHVRNVSPNKEMMRLSVLLTKNIVQHEEPAKKRLKMEDNSNFCVDNDIVGRHGEKQTFTKDKKCFQSSNSPQYQIESKSTESAD